MNKTAYIGFEEEEIKAELNKIIDAVEEIENMTDEEKQEKLKSWEDIKKKWEDDEKEMGDEETNSFLS